MSSGEQDGDTGFRGKLSSDTIREHMRAGGGALMLTPRWLPSG